MQTFLPSPDFATSAAALDDRRLGKQRSENIQILRALTVPGYGWRRHPAAAMWAGYEEALVSYGVVICDEWRRRGHADTVEATLRGELQTTVEVSDVRDQGTLAAAGDLPPWLGDPSFHRSHRSALLRKDPDHYRHLFEDVPDDLPYVWPPSDRPRRVPVDALA